MPFKALNAVEASNALAGIGVAVSPSHLILEAREERWLGRLPGERLAWFAASDDGRSRLQIERRVLKLLAVRCGFCIPRVVAEDAVGDCEVREPAAGIADAVGLYQAVRSNKDIAWQVGASIGASLADQHSSIRESDVAGWLRTNLSWPETAEWVRSRLPSVIADRELIARANETMLRYHITQVAAVDRAFVHGDLGFHNVSFDPVSYVVKGVFDYEGAAWADRHHDFQYLVLDTDCPDLLEGALAAYQSSCGYRLNRNRIHLYNAACAVTYLAFRSGRAPEEEWCGRTLDQDLNWTRIALARLT